MNNKIDRKNSISDGKKYFIDDWYLWNSNFETAFKIINLKGFNDDKLIDLIDQNVKKIYSDQQKE